MLVKVTAHGLRFLDASRRMERSLQEFRVRGVKTNIPFLINLVTHPSFLAGGCTTRFIDDTPELFRFRPRQDRASKLIGYIGEVIVNGNPEVRDKETRRQGDKETRRTDGPSVSLSPCLLVSLSPPQPGTRDRFREMGPEKFAEWVLAQQQ